MQLSRHTLELQQHVLALSLYKVKGRLPKIKFEYIVIESNIAKLITFTL